MMKRLTLAFSLSLSVSCLKVCLACYLLSRSLGHGDPGRVSADRPRPRGPAHPHRPASSGFPLPPLLDRYIAPWPEVAKLSQEPLFSMDSLT